MCIQFDAARSWGITEDGGKITPKKRIRERRSMLLSSTPKEVGQNQDMCHKHIPIDPILTKDKYACVGA